MPQHAIESLKIVFILILQFKLINAAKIRILLF